MVDKIPPPVPYDQLVKNIPAVYTVELADKICELIIEPMNLRDICARNDMPCVTTFFKWLRIHEDFAEQYARAKEEQAEIMAADMLEIADDGRNDFEEKKNKDGSTYIALRSEHVTRSKLRVEARKWLMSKFKPKKYGDAAMIKHADADGNSLEIKTVFVSPEEAAAAYAKAMKDGK